MPTFVSCFVLSCLVLFSHCLAGYFLPYWCHYSHLLLPPQAGRVNLPLGPLSNFTLLLYHFVPWVVNLFSCSFFSRLRASWVLGVDFLSLDSHAYNSKWYLLGFQIESPDVYANKWKKKSEWFHILRSLWILIHPFQFGVTYNFSKILSLFTSKPLTDKE